MDVIIAIEFYMSSFNSITFPPKEDSRKIEQFFKKTSLTSNWVLSHCMVVYGGPFVVTGP